MNSDLILYARAIAIVREIAKVIFIVITVRFLIGGLISNLSGWIFIAK